MDWKEIKLLDDIPEEYKDGRIIVVKGTTNNSFDETTTKETDTLISIQWKEISDPGDEEKRFAWVLTGIPTYLNPRYFIELDKLFKEE